MAETMIDLEGFIISGLANFALWGLLALWFKFTKDMLKGYAKNLFNVFKKH